MKKAVSPGNFYRKSNNFDIYDDIESILLKECNIHIKPRITIAIPTYNRTEFLVETLNSALNQEGCTEEYEVLVLDNNSLRHCATEEYVIGLNHPYISYYKNSGNIGMVGNWNRLFKLALGEYVVLLHDDDLISENYLKVISTYLNAKRSIGLIQPKKLYFKNVDELNSKILLRNLVIDENRALKQIFDVDNFNTFYLGAPTGCLLNKQAVLEFGGFNNDFYPAHDFQFVNLFSCYYNTFELDHNLVYYRFSVNESLRIETIRSFIINDYWLRIALFRKYSIPFIIYEPFLSCVIEKHIEFWKSLNKEFEFDQKYLFPHYSNIRIGVAKNLVKYYFKIQRFFMILKKRFSLSISD